MLRVCVFTLYTHVHISGYCVWPLEVGESSGELVRVWSFWLERNLQHVEMVETYQREDGWVNRWVAGANTL